MRRCCHKIKHNEKLLVLGIHFVNLELFLRKSEMHVCERPLTISFWRSKWSELGLFRSRNTNWPLSNQRAVFIIQDTWHKITNQIAVSSQVTQTNQSVKALKQQQTKPVLSVARDTRGPEWKYSSSQCEWDNANITTSYYSYPYGSILVTWHTLTNQRAAF